MSAATWLLVSVLSGQAPVNDPAFKQVSDLFQKAADAQNKGELAQSNAFFTQALAVQPLPPALKSLPAMLHMGMACNHVKMGALDKGLASIQRAVDAGYAEVDEVTQDPCLEPLGHHPGFKAVVAHVRRNAERARVYQVLEWHSTDVGWAGLHRFEDMDGPTLTLLRERYHLDAVVAGAADEREVQSRLLAWVHNRWAHAGLHEPSRHDALTILAEVDAGKRFRCVEYSVVLASVMQAMGYPARVLSLRRDGMSFGLGKGHVVSEVWSNPLHKWLVMDGQNHGTWEVDGTPLNADEIRTAWHEHNPRLRFHLGATTWRHSSDEAEMGKAWGVYFAHFSVPRNNTYPPGPPDTLDLLAPFELPELLFQGRAVEGRASTRDRTRVYPPMNAVHVELMAPPQGAPGTLEVRLSHSAPWFDHYVITRNGTAGNLSASSTTWELQPGDNTLAVQTVNHMGVMGTPSRVVLRYHPPAPAQNP